VLQPTCESVAAPVGARFCRDWGDGLGLRRIRGPTDRRQPDIEESTKRKGMR